MTSEQIRLLVAGIQEDLACKRMLDFMACSSFTDREQRRQARLTAALNDPVFGWKVAQCLADQRRLVPPSIRIQAIRRANIAAAGNLMPNAIEPRFTAVSRTGAAPIVMSNLFTTTK